MDINRIFCGDAIDVDAESVSSAMTVPTTLGNSSTSSPHTTADCDSTDHVSRNEPLSLACSPTPPTPSIASSSSAQSHSVTPLTPARLDTMGGFANFRKGRGGKYKITKNLEVDEVWCPTTLPLAFPCAPGGIATIVSIANDGPFSKCALHNVDTKKFCDRIGCGNPYSVRMKKDGKSSVILASGESFPVRRVKGDCNGEKSCASSIAVNSKHHFGVQECSLRKLPSILCISASSSDTIEKARDVLFFGQQHFPTTCAHKGVAVRVVGQRCDRLSPQCRVPNWEFVKGGDVVRDTPQGKITTRRPDFIGCRMFGSLGARQRSSCNVIILPDHLQGADKKLVDTYLDQASRHIFPSEPESLKDKCPPSPTSSASPYCPNRVHGEEVVKVSVISCSVRFQYLIHDSNGKPDWAIVLGYGTHSHARPCPNPTPEQVKNTVECTLSSNRNATIRELSIAVSDEHGSRPSRAALQRRKYDFRVASNPFGRHLDGLVRLQHQITGDETTHYVQEIIDQRCSDEGRVVRDQVGIVIILSQLELMKRCVQHPHFSCDGTFNMVSSNGDDINYELVSIISKDPLTGRMFCPMRMIASRKTTAARLILFDRFIRALKLLGLEDPLTTDASSRITIATDFETTFSVAIGKILAEIFRPDQDMTELSMRYIEKVCFGCSVHAKRMILEKVNIQTDRTTYQWLFGTRILESAKEIDFALEEMSTINVKLWHFSKWLRSNKVAHVLWFWKYYKTTTSGVYRRILWSTNISECEHAVLKGSADYLLTKCRGLNLVSLASFLERHDLNEFKNISGELGVPHAATPAYLRTPKKRSRAADDSFIDVDGCSVHASQPKRAKR